MFLCKPCHEEESPECDQWLCDFDIVLNISYGKCESCGEKKKCVDCQSAHKAGGEA